MSEREKENNMAKKLIQEDLAIMRAMYEQAGKVEFFDNNIKPHIKTQEDLEDLAKTSFQDPSVRTAFSGVLTQNEFVDQFYNIYRQRMLNLLSGKIPYLAAFLKEAPFSGSQGYISQDIKSGQDFTFTFSEGLFNPEKRPAYLQVISTKIKRQYSDELSLAVIGRAASNEGGLNSYISQRIALLEEDFTAEIRAVMLEAIDTVKGKEVTITVPTELQGVMQAEQRARYIMQQVAAELKYLPDNSTDYTDNGFTTRKPVTELVGLISREAEAEMAVQALGMLRNKKDAIAGMKLGEMIDVPTTEMTDGFYMKFMTPKKIHYSNSISVSGLDKLNINMKGVYSKTVFTEMDVIDTEPALTIYVENGTESAAEMKVARVSKLEKDLVKRTNTAKAKRVKFYDRLKELYGKKSKAVIVTAPVDGTVVDEEVAQEAAA